VKCHAEVELTGVGPISEDRFNALADAHYDIDASRPCPHPQNSRLAYGKIITPDYMAALRRAAEISAAVTSQARSSAAARCIRTRRTVRGDHTAS
jgi:hypothetical protein